MPPFSTGGTKLSNKKSGYIFVTKFTKNGVTYYAKDYGKKAFRIPANRK